MNPTELKIYNVLKEKGPLLPVEIGSEVGLNVLLTSAVLAGMVNNKTILKTYKKIGNSALYFLPNHYEQARQIILNRLSLVEKNLLQKFEANKVIYYNDLTPQERFFLKEIRDFVLPGQINDKVFWRYYTVSNEEALSILNNNKLSENKVITKESNDLEKKDTIKKQEFDIFSNVKVKQESKKVKVNKFEDKVISFFESRKIMIQKKEIIKKGYEMNLFAFIPTAVGHQAYFIKARKKSKFTDKDLAYVWLEAKKYNMPVLILVDGSIAKNTRLALSKNELNYLISLREL